MEFYADLIYKKDVDDGKFRVGDQYRCLIKQGWFGSITVRPVNQYDYATIKGYGRTYRDLDAFLKVWQYVRCLHPEDRHLGGPLDG